MSKAIACFNLLLCKADSIRFTKIIALVFKKKKKKKKKKKLGREGKKSTNL